MIGRIQATMTLKDSLFRTISEEDNQWVRSICFSAPIGSYLQQNRRIEAGLRSNASYEAKRFLAWESLPTSAAAQRWAALNFSGAELDYLCEWGPHEDEGSGLAKNPALTADNLNAVLRKISWNTANSIVAELPFTHDFLKVIAASDFIRWEAESLASFLRRNPELSEDERNFPDEWLASLVF
jgi:hypothetical protein